MTEITFPRQQLGLVLLILVLAGVLGFAMWTWQGPRPNQGSADERPLEGLKVFGTVPDFSLVERGGRPVRLADLRGKVWIANFIYTHCTETCPLQSAEMARLQADLASEPDVRLVSITVDPERDTPDVLAEYANRFGADRDRWLFLTGEKGAIYALAQEGFRLSAVDPAEALKTTPPDRAPGDKKQQTRVLLRTVASLFAPAPVLAHSGHLGKPFLHSSRFVLVDRRAQIRGYYHSEDRQALARLRNDARVLLREGEA